MYIPVSQPSVHGRTPKISLFTSRGNHKHENINRPENKEAADKARTLFQYSQLPDKYSRGISRVIWKFHCVLKCFYIYSTIYSGTHDDDDDDDDDMMTTIYGTLVRKRSFTQ
jgi:hypothetical protein